jgi:hypothetical protein
MAEIWAEGTDIRVSFTGPGSISEGIFIRAAIRYLSELSFQNISHQILVNEGIIPPGPFHGSAHDEMVIITNYRSRIEEAIRLLNSWVREVRPRGGEGSLVSIDRTPGYMGGFEMPIADSILPPGVTPNTMFACMDAMGINYRIDRIPKTMPPVLAQLKLEGLHHYVALDGEFNYQQSMEVADFMEKAVREEDFPEDTWHAETGELHFIHQMKNVFRACLVDDVVIIG